MKRIYLFVGILAIAACRSSLDYTEGTAPRPESSRMTPYHLASPSDESGKMLVLLNENPDTIELRTSELAEYFADRDYHILVPSKPGRDAAHTRSIDNKRDRIFDLIGVLQHLDSLHTDELVIFGVGEGGYLAPELARQMAADLAIVVNASHHSALYEMEQWLRADSITPAFNQMLSQKNITDTADLRERINIVREDRFGLDRISPGTNNYWMSYNESPMINDLSLTRGQVLWINFEDYPLVAPNSREANEMLAKSLRNVERRILPGNGNLNNEEQMELLIKEVDNFRTPD